MFCSWLDADPDNAATSASRSSWKASIPTSSCSRRSHRARWVRCSRTSCTCLAYTYSSCASRSIQRAMATTAGVGSVGSGAGARGGVTSSTSISTASGELGARWSAGAPSASRVTASDGAAGRAVWTGEGPVAGCKDGRGTSGTGWCSIARAGNDGERPCGGRGNGGPSTLAGPTASPS